MNLTAKEKVMCFVAINNLVVDYKRTLKKARRVGNDATVKLAENAIRRYSYLAKRMIT